MQQSVMHWRHSVDTSPWPHGDRRGRPGMPAPPARRPGPRPRRPGIESARHTVQPPRRRRHSTRLRRRGAGPAAGRCVLGLLSGLILITTCYTWATLRSLSAGLSTDDVISSGPSSPDGATNILLVGDDSRTDAQGNPLPDAVLKTLRTSEDGGSNNTDTMILVRISHGGQHVTAVSLPRDTLVNFGGGEGTQKLNAAMATGMEEERERLVAQGVSDPRQLTVQARAAGQKLLIKTVEKLTGAHIDHYAEVNLLGFYQITNAIGGVDVCLKNPVDDHLSGAHFHAGPQNIQGGDALAFVRQRHGLPRGDLDRVVRQQVFLSGLARKLLSTGMLGDPERMSHLIAALHQSVILDTGWNILGFATQLQGITGGNIEFHTIPVHLRGPLGQEDVVADIDQVHQFVADLDLDPAARQAKKQADAANRALRGKTTVTVYNASEVNGLAKSVLNTLTGQGFVRGTSGNAAPSGISSVHYPPDDPAAAHLVSGSLGKLRTQPDTKLPAGTVVVYLGSDYRGPGFETADGTTAQNFATRPAAPVGPMARPQPTHQPNHQQITAAGVACVN
jgi:LCP family protein required for cell wall assembly